MGAWGAGIFQDDSACDVRDSYNDLVALKFEDEEILKELIGQFQITGEEDNIDESTFWIALALSQHKMGRLSDSVKEKALEYIDSGNALKDWTELAEDDKASIKSRDKALHKAKDTILSPQPPRKNPKPSHYLRQKIDKVFYSYPWERNNLYSYKLDNGEYVILACVNVDSIKLDGYYKKFGDRYVKDSIPELYQATLLLLDYKGLVLPAKSDVDKAEPLIFDCDEEIRMAFADSVNNSLASARGHLSKDFETFRSHTSAYYGNKFSDNEIKIKYEQLIKNAEEDVQRYQDTEVALRRCFYKTYIIDPKLDIPESKINSLGNSSKLYEYEGYYYAVNWDGLERSVSKWNAYELFLGFRRI